MCKSRSVQSVFDGRHLALLDGIIQHKTCVCMFMCIVFVVSLPISFYSHPHLGVCVFRSDSLILWLLCHFLTVCTVTLSPSDPSDGGVQQEFVSTSGAFGGNSAGVSR